MALPSPCCGTACSGLHGRQLPCKCAQPCSRVGTPCPPARCAMVVKRIRTAISTEEREGTRNRGTKVSQRRLHRLLKRSAISATRNDGLGTRIRGTLPRDDYFPARLFHFVTRSEQTLGSCASLTLPRPGKKIPNKKTQCHVRVKR